MAEVVAIARVRRRLRDDARNGGGSSSPSDDEEGEASGASLSASAQSHMFKSRTYAAPEAHSAALLRPQAWKARAPTPPDVLMFRAKSEGSIGRDEGPGKGGSSARAGPREAAGEADGGEAVRPTRSLNDRAVRATEAAVAASVAASVAAQCAATANGASEQLSRDGSSGSASLREDSNLLAHKTTRKMVSFARDVNGPLLENGEEGREGGVGAGDSGGASGLKRRMSEDREGMTAAGAPLTAPWEDSEATYPMDDLKDTDDQVITELFWKTRQAKEQQENYKNACFFLMFAAIYFAVLYLQANSGVSYEVALAHQQLMPASFDASQPNRFNGPSDFYQWLNDSVIQVLWQDPYCGDGTCDQPLETKAYGTFGCEIDCGKFPNITTVTLVMEQNFDTEESRQQSSWNLCLVSPINQCWFVGPQPFPSVTGSFSQEVEVIDGDWKVLITAPKGGVSGRIVGPASDSGSGQGSPSMLVQWGECLPLETSKLALCRKTCADVAACLASLCAPPLSSARLAETMVDCVHQCDLDTAPVLAMQNQTCADVAPIVDSLLHTNCSAAAAADSRARIGRARSRIALAASPPVGVILPPAARQALWASLGATDDQRMFNIRVAVGRLLYTAAKDSCLVDRAKNLSSPMRDAMTAFVCTLLGGNASIPGCSYMGLSSIPDLWRRMQAAHAGADVSREHQERYVGLLVSALRSVAPIAEDEGDDIADALRIFDSAIVNASNPGCRSAEGPVLNWVRGEQHNTTLYAGGRITWVWGDDVPHSIKATGDTPPDTFKGIGSNVQVLSRLTECTPSSVGEADDTDLPTPCVLHPSWEQRGQFSFSALFPEPGRYTYAGGRLGRALSGEVRVIPAQQQAEDLLHIPVNLTRECSPGCAFWKLSNGQCDAACNRPECAFDGGDCACVRPGLNFPYCSCPSGQSRLSTGECCESSTVGENLNFSFSVRTFGPDYLSTSSVVVIRDSAIPRYIGKNRLLVGMMIVQSRVSGAPCAQSNLANLTDCSGPSTVQSFGVNPHFLPTSSLYNPNALEEIEQYSSANFAFSLERTPQGLPYGFIWPQAAAKAGLTGYPLVFDVNLNNKGATNRLQYLVDGFYLDNATRSVRVYLVTYNGDEELFTLSKVEVNVNEGGSYSSNYAIQTVPIDSYQWNSVDIARFFLELVYLCCVAWNVLEEVLEMVHIKIETGRVTNYFRHAWNWVDILSLAIQLTGIGLWVYLQHEGAVLATIQPRYNIYFTLLEFPRYWAMPNPPTGFFNATAAAQELNQVINVRTVYFSLQGINVFLVTLRLLKLLDFQPYLGIITRSIAVAGPALLHFLLVWICVIFSFALFGFLVFGASMQQFSTLWQSFLTCFLVMMNDNGVQYYFMQMQGWQYAAGCIWFFSYIAVVVLVLLNFLIAIIVDAFMDIKDAEEHPTTIAEDVQTMFRRLRGRACGSFWRYDPIIKHLYSLGADDFRKAQASSMRKSSLGRALRKLNLMDLFSKAELFAPVEPTKMVMKVKGGEQCVDPISLQNVMQRCYERYNERNPEEDHSSWRHKLKSFRPGSQRVDHIEERRLEELSDTLMGMFGERMEASKVKPLQPLAQPPHTKKQDILEIRGRLQALQEDTNSAFMELRSLVLDLNKQVALLQQNPNQQTLQTGGSQTGGSPENPQLSATGASSPGDSFESVPKSFNE